MPGPTKIKIGITTLMSGGKLGSSYPVVSVEQRTVNRLYSEAEIVGVLVSSKTESNSSFYDGQFWRLREGTEEYEIIPDDSSDEENAGDGVGSLSCLTPLNIELVAKECKRIFDEMVPELNFRIKNGGTLAKVSLITLVGYVEYNRSDAQH